MYCPHKYFKNGNFCCSECLTFGGTPQQNEEKFVLSLEQVSPWEDLHLLPGALTTNILDSCCLSLTLISRTNGVNSPNRGIAAIKTQPG